MDDMTAPGPAAVRLDPRDNVATAIRALAIGETAQGIPVTDPIPRGHKLALAPIATGAEVVKYAQGIGAASSDIAPGQHIHTHNLAFHASRQDH